jgi:hypothetical protein
MKDILKHNSSSGASSSSSSMPSSEQEDISAIANAQVLSRSIPGAVIAHFVAKIATLEEEMVNVMKEERMRAKVAAAEEEATRAENMILHEAEISARPARTWYQTETQKKALRDAGREKVKAELEALAEDDDAGAQQKKARKRGRNSHGGSDDDDEGYDEGLLQSEKLAKKLAGSDDYRRDEPVKGEGKENHHRMSRKKRRRLEAMKVVEEERAKEEEERAANPDPAPAKPAKSGKKTLSLREAELEKRNRTIDEISGLQNQKAGKNGMKFISRPKFAVGGLDQDMLNDSGSDRVSKKQLRLQARKGEKEFTDFDPNMRLRKQGKIGKSSFKSKAKFKRRK